MANIHNSTSLVLHDLFGCPFLAESTSGTRRRQPRVFQGSRKLYHSYCQADDCKNSHLLHQLGSVAERTKQDSIQDRETDQVVRTTYIEVPRIDLLRCSVDGRCQTIVRLITTGLDPHSNLKFGSSLKISSVQARLQN